MATESNRPATGPLVVLPREMAHQLPSDQEVGSKAHHLARLLHVKARVPRFGLLAAAAFDDHMASDSIVGPFGAARELLDDDAATAAADGLANAVRNAPLSARTRNALDELVDAFTDADLLAIRPSIIGPPGEVLAMAGHLETFLFVRGKSAVRESVHLVYASAFSQAALNARIDAGLAPFDTRIAIVIQRMVMADSSGSTASLDIDAPAGRPPQTIVEATLGVGGGASRSQMRLPTDVFRVSRPLLAEEALKENADVVSEIAKKRQALVLDEAQGHGSILSPTDAAAADQPALTSVQARVVADEALRLEAATGRPVALEFAFSGRLLHILQMHPLETPETKIPSLTERVFDKRVLPEDIAGPALPASQSIARSTVAEGLALALDAMGAKRPLPVEVKRATDRLVATVNGHLTGNVSALRTAANAIQFGGWQGAAVGRALGSLDFDPVRQGEVTRSGLSTWKLIRLTSQVERQATALTADCASFMARAFDDSERIRFAGLVDLDPDRLADLVDELVALLTEARAIQWRSRLAWAFAKDLTLEQLQRTEVSRNATFVADLCTPAAATSDLALFRKVEKLAASVEQSDVITSLFAQEPRSDAVLDRLEELPGARGFDSGFRTTIDHDGVHIAERNALELPTFEERPDLLLNFIRRATQVPSTTTVEKRMAAADGRRKKAEYVVTSQVTERALLFFKKDALILRAATAAQDAAAVNVSISRMCGRLSGVSRRCLLALGARLYEHDLIDQPSDVMWLDVDETTGAIRGSSGDESPRLLVAARKRAYAQHESSVDERTVTVGVVAGALVRPAAAPIATATVKELQARPVAPGEVRGRISRLPHLDGGAQPPSTDSAQVGAVVLVVPDLQLSWASALLRADGVIAERGAPTDAMAMLLHAFSIPCVTGATHALKILEDGEEVAVDGESGSIVRLSLADDEDREAAEATAPEDFARLAAPSSDNLVRPQLIDHRSPVLAAKETSAFTQTPETGSVDVDDEAILDDTAYDIDQTGEDLNRTDAIERPAVDEDSQNQSETSGPVGGGVAPFGAPHTLAVDAEQVESIEDASGDHDLEAEAVSTNDDNREDATGDKTERDDGGNNDGNANGESNDDCKSLSERIEAAADRA